MSTDPFGAALDSVGRQLENIVHMERTALTEALPALDAADKLLTAPREDLADRFPGMNRRGGGEAL
ncbi:hypothetical protein ML5_0863 [Micromonospora sp. L5]|uniref:hypothetical protein n=1 Tax=Micromonospora sp. (strain L5) TaxID=648999 RepID=UPI0001C45C8F|nr:hypothetical protein [Micromonospora sp. L5]ADU06405.1 hypothetical protein ML5_0863 [Micromonospora sp. L5]